MRQKFLFLLVMLLSNYTVAAGEREYHDLFYSKAHNFAERNRFHIANLPLDVRNRCYLAVKIRTTVLASGNPTQTEVIESSGFPQLDKYFQYVINQAAPYPSLDRYITPDTDVIALESLFVLDLRYFDEARRSSGPCSEFKMRRLLGEYSI
jgi:hypothetical protein